MDDDDEVSGRTVDTYYDQFIKTVDFLPTLDAFQQLCQYLDINQKNYKTIFQSLKSRLTSWKCQNLFNRLEKKSKHADYKNKPGAKLKVLVIGSGPVGLRTAIELAYLGAHVIVIEKRDSFSRNNVLHLWPFLIVDLKALGVKSFFGKFCAGSLDHISIRRLQVILLKMCLMLGVQVLPKVMFTGITEPADGKGWRCNFKPSNPSLASIDFDCIVGCDGKGNSLKFQRKEFRGKLAIAITCNFVNKQTTDEARVEEISGVAFIYNQDFFQELSDRSGIELENIVYYRDETHYFVMTAKKKSLLNKNVIKQDTKDVFKLLSADNINHNALLQYAKEAADFSTKYQLPHHEFAVNHYGKEDVAMFDFTSIHQAKSASKILERKGKRLLLCIAGDVLLEPFWPTGSGCARGFLGALDAAWMVRGLGLGHDSLDLIQERESIFTLLPQTKPDMLIRHHDKYSINPATRYLNLNARLMKKDQIRYLLDATDQKVDLENWQEKTIKADHSKPIRVNKKEKEVDPDTLLRWCIQQTADYPNCKVINMSSSWQSGLAFCAIINRFRPDLIDYFQLDPEDREGNCEKAFSVAEEHLGIPPKISTHDLATQKKIDQLAIMAYLSLYYEALKNETPALIVNETVNIIDEETLRMITPRVNEPLLSSRSTKKKSFLISPRSVNEPLLSARSLKKSFLSPRVAIPPSQPVPRSPKRFGFRVALVTKKPGSSTPRDIPSNETNSESGSGSPHKSHMSKMSILSKLSRRSKKHKANKLNKKSKKDKESKLQTGDSDGIVLKSYDEKISPRNADITSAAPNGDITSKTNKNGNTTSRNKPEDKKNTREIKTINGQEVEMRNPTTGVDKYKRISALAESVFGDTIVQSGPGQPQQTKRRDSLNSLNQTNLSESEKCHFCSRKVYVMERQSAEGLFFHRKCFRCSVCKCHLLIGNYAFQVDDDDDTTGKFFCKMHYNKLIYQPNTKENVRQNEPIKKPSDKRRRPVTQIIQPSDVHQAFQSKSTDVVQLSPKFSRQIRDIQSQLKQNLPQLEIEKTQTKTYKKGLRGEEVDGPCFDDEGEEVPLEKGPYDRFAARSLLDRHPSLLRCTPQKTTEKITTSSFFTASKHSVSTPNLTKLIQEDSMFEEERQKQVEKLNNPKKKLSVPAQFTDNTNTPQREPSRKKKLSVPDDLKRTDIDLQRNDSLRDVYGSEDYLERNDSYRLDREDSYGAVHRRPLEERRAQYPVSMAFTDGLVSAGFRPVSVSIDIDDLEDEKKEITQEKPKKKKKLVLKKRKVKKINKEDTIDELDETTKPPSPTKKQASLERSIEKSIEKIQPVKETETKKKDKKKEDDWVMVKKDDVRQSDEDILSSSSSEEDEEEQQQSVGLFRRALGKKPKKKTLSPEEQKLADEKRKRREKRKIKKELKEREMKRLWEAQSIQRKLNEVDVSQFELEERARRVEKIMQDTSRKIYLLMTFHNVDVKVQVHFVPEL